MVHTFLFISQTFCTNTDRSRLEKKKKRVSLYCVTYQIAEWTDAHLHLTFVCADLLGYLIRSDIKNLQTTETMSVPIGIIFF